MNLLSAFYTFMTALFTALLMVPFLRRWAMDRGDLDQPDARKVHSVPTPRLGGVALYLSFLFAAIVFAPVDSCTRGFLAGSLVIFATGLVDDMAGITAKQKFAGEVIACLVTIMVGKHYLTTLGNLFGFGEIILHPVVGVPFTVFAVVGVINAINLIDGLDGLAGGVSVIALTAFLLLGLLTDDMVAVAISTALLGGVIGFLKYNFYPARIFMGDAGSLTVGFLLGFMAVHVTQHQSEVVSPVVPLLILGLPIADTVCVMSRRMLNGESPFSPDRTHVHHRFLNLGFEHRFTVLIMYGLSTFWVVLAVFGMRLPDYLLFYGYLAINLLGYLLLNSLQRRSRVLPGLMRDANESVRSSVIYSHMSSVADAGVPVIQALLALFSLVTVYELFMHNSVPWQIVVLLLLTGIALKIWGEEGGPYLMLVVYAATGIAAFEVWGGGRPLFGAYTVKQVGDVLIAVSVVFSFAKFVFRKTGEYFLETPDFLVLVVCITLAVASQSGAFGYPINGPLFRFVLLLFAVRTVLTRRGSTHLVVSNAVLGFLALLLCIGVLNP